MDQRKRSRVASGKVSLPARDASREDGPAAPEPKVSPSLAEAVRRRVDRLLWLAFRGHGGGNNDVR